MPVPGLILDPTSNAWRVTRAGRAAVLIDAGRYFGALRQAMLAARSTIFIVGWDIDSRTRLVDETGVAADGLPERFVDFLSALVKARPALTVHILAWDYSMLYALERELFPALSIGWRTPRRVRFCLDDNLPVGGAHHQKLVVIDDAVAFCGGLDVTIRRWDRHAHDPDDPMRVDPTGQPYGPFHDVQMLVDGETALVLGELVRERWYNGSFRRPPPLRPIGGPWPGDVQADFQDVQVAIARTQPAFEDQEAVREVEALFFASIDRAERTIYIENQFLTCTGFAERLARRMRENTALEAVIVGPRAHDTSVPEQTMRSGRIRIMRLFAEQGVAERVRLFYPEVRDGHRVADTMVHSKVMVVDDVLLRIGSANLNNRSMGVDTECDLAIEARTPEQRRHVERVRNVLLGHHCGCGAQEVAAALAQGGSLIGAAESLAARGHRLVPIDESRHEPIRWLETVDGIADPDHPIEAPPLLQGFMGMRPSASSFWRVARIFAAAFLVIALTLAWRFTPLSELARPHAVQSWLESVAESREAPFFVVGAFVLGGLVAFPVTLLIAATAAVFGPWLGFLYAASGTLASALVTYGIGAKLGRRLLDDVLGPRLHRVRRRLLQRGVLAVAAVRLVPIAPFTLVNLAAGASRIPLRDYMAGTVLGMSPGMLVLAALGFQIFTVLTQPTTANVLLFLAAVLAWIGLSMGVQALLLRTRSPEP